MAQPIHKPPQNSQEYPSPYDIPKLIWSKIETYFTKYGVDFRESKAQERVEGPVVVWEIYNRVPGRPDSQAQTRGPTHNRYVEREGAMLKEELFQFHTVTYRFKVYSTSVEECNKIAWDLEQLLPQAAGIVGRQENVPGLQLNFWRQTSQEEDRVVSSQDDLVLRNMLFVAQVPVFYTRTLPSLRTLLLQTYVGRKITNSGRLTRSSSSPIQYLSVDAGQAIVGFFAVFKLACATVQFDSRLQSGVDYFERVDDQGVLYIEWDDTQNPPAVGEDFRVEFFISAVRTSYPDLNPSPSI